MPLQCVGFSQKFHSTRIFCGCVGGVGLSIRDALANRAEGYYLGIFPAVQRVHDDLLARYAVQWLGPCDDIMEHFYAIGTDKKVQHPLVQRLLQSMS